MSPTARLRLHLLLGIFVLSGFAGLIYQSIWSHYLGLFLGHAAYAQALVLAIFMGGMAAGAGLVARSGQGWRNLVRGYAIVEAVIGLLGLVFHVVFVYMLGLSYETIMPALGQPWLVNAYKWLLAAVLILPQTILLGMTFPMMSGGIIRRFPGRDGNVLGNLYFTNSIGAAVGVLIAAFVLLPNLGLPGAMVVAGVLNLLVAGLAWWLGSGREAPRKASPAEKGGESEGRGRFLLKVVLIATFLSGAASFAYEIVWIRMLSLAVGSTLHAFELMLASFIAGIAFGGLWVRRRADRSKDPLRLVGWLQVLMGLAALLSLVLYANAFTWVGFFMESLSRTDGAYSLFNLGTAAIAILIMMPAAFFAGTTLPLFTVTLLRDGQGEASIGRVYAWNTVGAIVGVFAAIHFLIPVLGLKLALTAAALLDMAVGLVLLRMRVTDSRGFVAVGIGTFVVVLSLALTTMLVAFDPMRLSSGVYRSGMAELPEGDQILYYRDGKTASVSLAARGSVLRIATNGKVDAAIQMADDGDPTGDEPTMVLAAALPLAYKPEARQVAVIGFGSGLTTHALLADPALERVDTIEIEEAMVAGARGFGSRVERAYNDPRSNIVIDDAKSYFAGGQRRYDIIVSEPSNPWISGVGALFSKEFYEFVPHFLTEDGILLQWLQLYEIDEALVGSVLNALTPAFADYKAYLANSSDLLILASPSQLPRDADLAKLFEGAMADELKRVGVEHPEQLAFRQLADARLLRAFARLYNTRPNSDYFPVLSLNAPRSRFRGMAARNISGAAWLDSPLLEWLDVRKPLPAAVTAASVDYFPADFYTLEARRMAEALIGLSNQGEVETTPSAQEFALTFNALTMDCEADWSEARIDVVAGQALRLAHATLSLLDVDGQSGILIDPAWAQCESLPEELAEMLALLEAHARRDVKGMEGLGRDWLRNAGERSDVLNTFDPLALAGVQFSLIRQDRLDEVAVVEETLGKDVIASGEYGFVRSLLLAWLDE